MGRLNIRVPDKDVQTWKEKAQAAGKNLSEWIREQCNLTATGQVVVLRSENAGGEPEDHRISKVPRARKVREDVGREPVAGGVMPGKTCVHGVQKGYHCWQCRGMANVKGE